MGNIIHFQATGKIGIICFFLLSRSRILEQHKKIWKIIYINTKQNIKLESFSFYLSEGQRIAIFEATDCTFEWFLMRSRLKKISSNYRDFAQPESIINAISSGYSISCQGFLGTFIIYIAHMFSMKLMYAFYAVVTVFVFLKEKTHTRNTFEVNLNFVLVCMFWLWLREI